MVKIEGKNGRVDVMVIIEDLCDGDNKRVDVMVKIDEWM